MAKKYHSIHAYVALEAYFVKIDQWLGSKTYSLLGCDADTVKHRLTQRMVELVLGPFVTQLAQRVRSEQAFSFPDRVKLNLHGIQIDTQSGEIDLALSALLRACLDFTAHWLHALYSILCIGMARSRGKATLIFGLGAESLFYEGNDQRFVEFCRRGPITPLATAARLIVQNASRSGACSDPWASYSRYPVTQLAKESRIDWYSRIGLLCRHLLMPARYAWAVMRCRPLALLGRDFALGPLMATLDRAGTIEAVVFTNSNYTIQPMWARASRTYQTNMVWYSQNVFPFVMKGDGFFTYLPNNRYMQVDKHWVWTAGFRQYLIKQGGRMHDIEVVGPVMWYLSNGVKRKSQNTFRIAVFDVTPISDGYAESIGILENYYCPSTAKSFLKGVLEVVENLSNVIGVDFTVSLKHKRNYSVTHDRNYIQQVKNSLEKGVIELVPFDINVYDFLSECDIALVTPYSSPVYLASAVQVPSIYFDPTANIEPSFEGAPNIIFASGKDELMQKLLSFYQAV